jgi:choline transport protein
MLQQREGRPFCCFTYFTNGMFEVKTAQSQIHSVPAHHETEVVARKDAITEDALDMLRMGKTQETRRTFRSITILSFCMVVLTMWETMLATSVFALSNGGPAGLIWGYLIVMVGFGFVVASLAEMASM